MTSNTEIREIKRYLADKRINNIPMDVLIRDIDRHRRHTSEWRSMTNNDGFSNDYQYFITRKSDANTALLILNEGVKYQIKRTLSRHGGWVDCYGGPLIEGWKFWCDSYISWRIKDKS